MPVEAASGKDEVSDAPGATGSRPLPPWGWFLAGGLAVIALGVSGVLGSLRADGRVRHRRRRPWWPWCSAVRHHRPALTWPWWAISGSMAFFLVGGALRVDLHTLGNITASRSLVPDLLVAARLRPGRGRDCSASPGPATAAASGTSASILDAVDRRVGHPGGGVGLRHRPRAVPVPHAADDPARAHVLPGRCRSSWSWSRCASPSAPSRTASRRTGSCSPP